SGHLQKVTSINFTGDGLHALSGSKDGTVRIWNLKTGKEIATMLSDVNGHWIIYTPDGYFDASKDTGGMLHIASGLNAFAIDQFSIRNNRPGIILERLQSSHRDLIFHFKALHQARLRRDGFRKDQLTGDYHVPEVSIVNHIQTGKTARLTLWFRDSKYPIKIYNIFINDVPLFGARGKALEKNNVKVTEIVELGSGRNKIEVSCTNVNGAESFRDLIYLNYEKPVQTDLYFLGFGISQYKDRILNLKYADNDVIDLGNVFARMEGKIFDNVFKETYLNKQVNRENIRMAKKFLMRAKVDDTVVLMIAGHGLHDLDAAATYYFLTHETDLEDLKKTAVNFDFIEDLLQGIKPRKKLFLMDTCDSGELEEKAYEEYDRLSKIDGISARSTRGIKLAYKKVKMNQQRQRTLVYHKDRFIYNDLIRRSGAIVISSSKGNEASMEMDALKNGCFTEE
ncbi:caspase family protein, partial [bacterium]|nr:caspase family protein [bacterium]